MTKEYIIKVNEDKKDIMKNMSLQEKPIELVRCKDCRYYRYSNIHNQYYCKKMGSGYFKSEDWFCPDGRYERK